VSNAPLSSALLADNANIDELAWAFSRMCASKRWTLRTSVVSCDNNNIRSAIRKELSFLTNMISVYFFVIFNKFELPKCNAATYLKCGFCLKF